MTARFVAPGDAAAEVLHAVRERWADAVCSEHDRGTSFTTVVRLSPGVRHGADVERLGFAARTAWLERWAQTPATLSGVELRRKPVSVQRVVEHLPHELQITGIDAAVEWVRCVSPAAVVPDLVRARRLAASMHDAGALVTPATLRRLSALDDTDAALALGAVRYLAANDRLGDLTDRQHPIIGIDTKWLRRHGSLVRTLLGRDVRRQFRERRAVAHLSYVDPDYLATGGRRHDAWTAGDTHDLAYLPSTVLVVENRDCRLWFPAMPGTVVVEGGGAAATSLLSNVDWVRGADSVAYWGDIDAHGFAILDSFRAALAIKTDDGAPARPVTSVLMDLMAFHRYEHLGVARDKNGRAIEPSSRRLRHLTDDEAAAYAAVATGGPAVVRRIEQERIDLQDAAEALRQVIAAR